MTMPSAIIRGESPQAAADTHAPRRRSGAGARNAGIDLLRGLAVVLVIVHHLALPFRLPLGPSLLGEWLPKRLLDAVGFNGYEAVFMFFAISGFLITIRIVERDGDIGRVDLRRFYLARVRRILPLLLVALALLAALAWLGIPGFAPDPATQSVAGLLGSALSFTFNLYEGRTGWAPAAWDVLWSLSIEEVFYLGFPLLCLRLPRRVLVCLLAAWALALVPLRDLVPASDEIWREKAYLPGMAAIAGACSRRCWPAAGAPAGGPPSPSAWPVRHASRRCSDGPMCWSATCTVPRSSGSAWAPA